MSEWHQTLFFLCSAAISPLERCSNTRTFTARGPSNLPVIAVYTENKAISAVVPGIATSKDAIQALAQRFAMQTVVEVLEFEGRRALLPDFVISNILGQLQVHTTYEPLRCQLLRGPGEKQMAIESCIIVGSTLTVFALQRRGHCNKRIVRRLQRQSTASTCPSQELSRLRTSSWLIGRGRCGKMFWTERF
ncbi:hypothetical protein KIN20_019259 [Parelaphostrongylus tenuis]|uniref:Uncharacterized protein n=1 Tax=Parelaphostrongylus tenuis TaxID=148309 RepID=A0AAD5MPA5_PARTN|nr:hypothetical protein KIN20_019259 [Parelaphostrongylus tenuis]